MRNPPCPSRQLKPLPVCCQPMKPPQAAVRTLTAGNGCNGSLDLNSMRKQRLDHSYILGYKWIHYAGNSGRLSWWRMANGSRSAMFGKGFHLKTHTWLLFLQETYYPFSNLQHGILSFLWFLDVFRQSAWHSAQELLDLVEP